MIIPRGGNPPSETGSLRCPSMEAGLKRQNSERRNQGSNHSRSNGICATDIFNEKLLVLLIASVCVFDPEPLPPILNEPQPTPPLALHFVLFCELNLSMCSVLSSNVAQPLFADAKLPG